MKLAGKVAIVTGAARGIGTACAERCLKEGAKVVVADIAAEALEKTVAAPGDPSRIVAIGADVSKRADVDKIVDTAARSSVASTSWSTTRAWRRTSRSSISPKRSTTRSSASI